MTGRVLSLPANLSSRVDALFARWARPDSPGMGVCVVHQGEEVHSAFYGMADIANGAALGPGSIVRIGSQTKQFAVLLLLMLEAEGKLSLDDDVRAHLPWLPRYPRTITLRHLAANVGGMRDYLDMMVIGGQMLETISSAEDARRLIAGLESVNFPPGEDFAYCNTGFFLLSDIVEQVSGATFDELLRQRITGPLGMKDTRLVPSDAARVPRMVDQHTRKPDGSFQTARWGVHLNGTGGMVSTLADMKRWLANMDSPRIGSPEMLARMSRPGAIINGVPSHYGLGLLTSHYRGHRNVSHSGVVAGGHSCSAWYPDLRLGIIVLGNTDDFDMAERVHRIADACLDADIGPRGQRIEDGVLARLTGTFRESGGDEVVRIAVVNGEPSLDGLCIQSISATTFRAHDELFPREFTLREDGDLDARWFGRVSRYRRLRDEVLPPPAGLEGVYTDRTTGLRAEIRIDGSTAIARLSSARADWECSLEARDFDFMVVKVDDSCSYIPPFTLRVVEGGLILNAPRVKKLRLEHAR